MRISIETPAFKGGWLIPCIESVLRQTSADWEFSLVWDGGDALSRQVLEKLQRLDHPRIRVYFTERQGIAKARRFLTERSRGEWILPLDDDDVLTPDAVEKFLAAVREKPWAGIIRGRRTFIDEAGKPVVMPEWFPFEARHYQGGMTTDLDNHCQPYLIRRSAYARTGGWEGFEDFHQAGEDCDIFLKVEEVAPVELLDRVLYHYRVNRLRTSNGLGPASAHEMWRRLADRTIARIGLPLRRRNDIRPFVYERLETPAMPARDLIDCVIPFFESNEEELPYAFRRPTAFMRPACQRLNAWSGHEQHFDAGVLPVDRLEVALLATPQLAGELTAEIVDRRDDPPLATASAEVSAGENVTRFVKLPLAWSERAPAGPLTLRFRFRPAPGNRSELRLYTIGGNVMMRLFRRSPGHSRRQLDRCLASLREHGIADDAIHVVERRQSSAANRNEGFRRTRRPFVAFLDDDVELVSDAPLILLRELIERRGDLASPKILDPQGRIYCADPFFDPMMKPVPKGLGDADTGTLDYVSEVPWLPSTMLLIRREVFPAVGGFDEDYVGSQMEDVDFCLRARQRGFRGYYVGTAAITHFNQQRNDSFDENFARFVAKWRGHPDLFRSIRPVDPAFTLAPA